MMILKKNPLNRKSIGSDAMQSQQVDQIDFGNDNDDIVDNEPIDDMMVMSPMLILLIKMIACKVLYLYLFCVHWMHRMQVERLAATSAAYVLEYFDTSEGW